MSNPRLIRYPTLSSPGPTYRMTPDEVYDYPYSLRWAEKRLETDPGVRAQDKKLIQAFMKHVAAQGVSTGRRAKYVYVLQRCAQEIRVPFRRAKRRDIEDLIMRLTDHEIVTKGPDGSQKRRHYSPETMADFRQMLKRFQKFVRYGDTDKDTPFPDEVKWLRDNVKLSERKEPEFFTDEEVEALIRAADTIRDKALIAVAGELGTRVSEVLLIRLGDVRFDDAGAILHIRRGKTGARTLRLISSVAYLADYVSTHPYRDKDPEAPLWLTTSTNHFNEPMSYVACSRMLKAAAAKAGVKHQRIHMYMFRHGSATRNAKYLSDAELRLMFGWSATSRMPAVYIHLSGGDLDMKYQQVYGSGKPVEPPKPAFAPPVCPRCQERGSPGMRFCPKCATPLEPGERAKAAAEEVATKKEISELRKLVEKSLQEHPASEGGRGSSPGRTSSA